MQENKPAGAGNWFAKNPIITIILGVVIGLPLGVAVLDSFFNNSVVDTIGALGLVGYLVYFYSKQKKMLPSQQTGTGASQGMVCTMCGYRGNSKRMVKGSLAIEIVLWLFFIIPGLIYSLWRTSSKDKVCPQCKHTTMIPASSLLGQKLIAEHKV